MIRLVGCSAGEYQKIFYFIDWVMEMDTPSSVRVPADLRVIVNSVSVFLDSSATVALRATSSEYKDAVAAAVSTGLVDKRRIEAKINETLNPLLVRDWARINNIITMNPVALYYTGDATDAEIAQKLGAKRPANDNEIIGHLETAAQNGYLEVFKVLLAHLIASGFVLDHSHYQVFISVALYHNHLNILALPEMIEQIRQSTAGDIIDTIEAISDMADVSPRVLDFYLSHVDLTLVSADDVDVYLSTVTMLGLIGVIKVLTKYKLFDFGARVVVAYDDEQLWKLFWNAATAGHLDLVKFLANQVDRIPDKIAPVIEAGRVEVMRFLLESGKLDGPLSYWEVYAGIETNQPAILRLLLAYPDLMRIESHSIRSWLWSAVNHDRDEIVSILLADPRLVLTLEQNNELIATAIYNDNQNIERMLRLR